MKKILLCIVALLSPLCCFGMQDTQITVQEEKECCKKTIKIIQEIYQLISENKVNNLLHKLDILFTHGCEHSQNLQLNDIGYKKLIHEAMVHQAVSSKQAIVYHQLKRQEAIKVN